MAPSLAPALLNTQLSLYAQRPLLVHATILQEDCLRLVHDIKSWTCFQSRQSFYACSSSAEILSASIRAQSDLSVLYRLVSLVAGL